MSRVGIVIALRSEVRTLSRALSQAGVVTQLEDGDFLIVSGIGAERALSSGRRLLEHGATALLSWGSAAALDPELQPGHVVVPHTVVGADGARVKVSSEWQKRVHECLADKIRTSIAPLAETHTVLTDPADKIALARERGASAADMESASVGRLAHHAGVPFLAVRAVSDSVSMTIPSWLLHGFDAFGRSPIATLCAGFLRNPTDLVTLARLARGFRTAMVALSQVKALAAAELRTPE